MSSFLILLILPQLPFYCPIEVYCPTSGNLFIVYGIAGQTAEDKDYDLKMLESDIQAIECYYFYSMLCWMLLWILLNPICGFYFSTFQTVL